MHVQKCHYFYLQNLLTLKGCHKFYVMCFNTPLTLSILLRSVLELWCLNKFNIDTGTWEDAATDRPEWCSLIADGAVSYEKQWLTGAEEKMRQRKSFSINSSSSYVCADCGRTFCAAIGLFSHKRTHRGSVHLPVNRDVVSVSTSRSRDRLETY